jgi:cytochrome P450
MTSDELIMFLILLVVAGNETTRNALAGGLVAFTRFPEQRRELLDHPELMDLAVEEIVRYVSPVISFMRTVTEDHTYRGVDLRTGDRVLLLYQSANRDEEVFEAPDELRIDRDPNPHLAFGIGTHYCLGANLARAEIKVAFEELFRRLRDIRAVDADALERGDSTLVLSLKRLPAVFTPESPS